MLVVHSQAGILARDALSSYLPELRERVFVVAIAPAAYILAGICKKAVHYRVRPWRDPIPRIDMIGSYFSRDSIMTISSHLNAPWFDHSLMSPTYERPLERHIENYIKSDGKSI